MESEHRFLWLIVLCHGMSPAERRADPEWIESEDFEAVCRLAGIDPDAARKREGIDWTRIKRGALAAATQAA